MNDAMGEGSAAPEAVSEDQRWSSARADAALVLEDGSVFWGRGAGAVGVAVGEVCFNTTVTGYQEVLTDPSYAGQIITFTFPHIGNVGDQSGRQRNADAGGARLRAAHADHRAGELAGHSAFSRLAEEKQPGRHFECRYKAADPSGFATAARPAAP